MLFETGYGPSGLPHIGTFNEVLRTTMVRRAYEALTGGAFTRLVAFSDDMDGLRKVPDNVPNGDMLREHLGKPLTAIPDPFGKFESFAHHNNAMLREFLDRFGFEYEFVRSEEHTSELQSLMRISYAVFCLKKKNKPQIIAKTTQACHTKHYHDCGYMEAAKTSIQDNPRS